MELSTSFPFGESIGDSSTAVNPGRGFEAGRAAPVCKSTGGAASIAVRLGVDRRGELKGIAGDACWDVVIIIPGDTLQLLYGEAAVEPNDLH